MKSHHTVQAYIAAADVGVRPLLRQVQALVKKTVPGATEGIAYGMPAYTWKDKPLFYFAAMKGHLGLYPTPGPIVACKGMLAGYATSKGCVRVPYDMPLPAALIKALVKERKREIGGR